MKWLCEAALSESELVLCPTNNWIKSRICFIMKHAPFQFSAMDIRRAADADRALAGGHGHAPAGRPALPVLAAATGRPETAIAAETSTNRKTVRLWKERFAAQGL